MQTRYLSRVSLRYICGRIHLFKVKHTHIYHRHISVMELGHLLTRSGLTCPEAFSKICHDSFCQLGNSVSLPWVIYYGAFYLHVSGFYCIPVIYLKFVLFSIPLQFVYLCMHNYTSQYFLYILFTPTCFDKMR